ncbi:hsp70-binding protein 1 [Microcaecilia unicolor]|uniref:Hsp70-binding protein 1 n=1 Tax=Microcaecilia unicolor TaxID=1415580 RepID=A0A6P7XKJ5_9AMPH|nr:hsp70-binding protein 1 [Microcaecilia unicolor]XP_030053712.1 hsp70-binding protein 1 [Microcaecilia unicolor]XP_030053713.1 hsp70-binding protein 1 [Microcaecilia unicolor]XP_030053714.1 hsp70-binding protein 1 [Microcaecilia unicolor]
MADGGSERNRQLPQNLQGLLRMAVEAGAASGEGSAAEPMPQERRQWLQEALASAFLGPADEVQQIKECLQCLQGEPGDGVEEEEEERREQALDLLADLCENIDNAADFCKLDGMRLLVERYLERPEAELRWRAAHLVGTCSQNVPFVQEHALALGAMGMLLRLLDRDHHETVRVKALFATSCLVREQEVGLLEFLKEDGFSVLMRAMQSDVMKLKVKSAFLLQNLLLSHPEHKDTLCAMGMVQQLVALLRTEHSAFHEHVLGALCSLVTDFPQGLEECRAPELGFQQLLEERRRLVQTQEEFQEELEFCERLLRICFQDSPEESSGMDR